MEYVISFFILIIERIAAYNLGMSLLTPRKKDVLVLSFACYLILAFILFNFVFPGTGLTESLIRIISMFVLFASAFKGSVGLTFLLALLYSIMSYGFDFVFVSVICRIAGINISEALMNPIAWIISAFASKSLLVYATYLLKLVLNKDNSKFKNDRQELIGVIWFPLFTYVLVLIIMNLIIKYNEASLWAGVAVVGILFATGVVVCLVNKVSQEKVELLYKLVESQQNNYDKASYELMKNMYQHERKNVHDFRNHLAVINNLIKNDVNAAERYVLDLQTDIQKESSMIATNNLAVDAVLNQKYALARDYKLHFIINISDLSNLTISNIDIVTILSNALDNAINAAKDTESKKIELSISSNDNECRIYLANSSKPVEILDNTVQIDPSRIDHGFGLKNIKRAVEKYDGTVNVSYNDGLFVLAVLIPY